MSLSDLFFVLIAGITVLGAFMAVWLKNVFYNALSLILCLFGVAAIFIFLNSEFLAVIEVIIYIGAISIAIIFAIMLSRPMFQQHEKRSPMKLARSLAAAALLLTGLWKVIRATRWPLVADPSQGDYSMNAIGKALLTTSLLPFEAVSLVLLVAIVGALVVSNTRDRQ